MWAISAENIPVAKFSNRRSEFHLEFEEELLFFAFSEILKLSMTYWETVCQCITYTVKSCIKAAAYEHFFDISGRILYKTGKIIIFKTGLCAAVVQLLAACTVQSMHAVIQHLCVPYMTSHTIHIIKSRIYKPWLLFESGLQKIVM